MYVCLKIYIRRALSKKVTVAPRSQTNRNVFNARLNRSVDKSAERRGRETVPDPGSSDSEKTAYCNSLPPWRTYHITYLAYRALAFHCSLLL